jgi:uncharacterized caspase-like protein
LAAPLEAIMLRRYLSLVAVFFTLAFVTAITAGPVLADKRVALLIGNAAYGKAPLTNPVNDVAVMKTVLTEAGFDIVEAYADLDRGGMLKALRTFEDAVEGADIGVIFYSGHGMELNGQNYLIPVDARLTSDRAIGDEAVSLDRVLDSLDGAKRLKLVLLDACRDNPFAASMKRIVAKGIPTKGLARVDPSGLTNMLIAYAAAPGQTASDGDGKNSPFTAALVKHLVMPGIDVEFALRQVRDDVLAATGQRQQPYKTGSLGGETLTLSKSMPPAVPSKPADDPIPALDADASARADFALAKQVGTVEMWDAFKRKYPTGFYFAAAEAERQKLLPPHVEPQVSLQTKPTESPEIPASPGLSAEQLALVKPIQAELRRLGCYTATEADWDASVMKSSIKSFIQYAKLPSVPEVPSDSLLEDLKARRGPLCPLICPLHEEERNGRCVAKECSRNEILDANGDCVAKPSAKVRHKEPPVVQNRPPRHVAVYHPAQHAGGGGRSRKCFNFNGSHYCE